MSTVSTVPLKTVWDPAKHLSMAGMAAVLDDCNKYGWKDDKSKLSTGFPCDMRHFVQMYDGAITAATCIKESDLKAAFGEQYWELALGWLQLVGQRSEVRFANEGPEKQAVWKRTQQPNKYPGKRLNPVDPSGDVLYSPNEFWAEHTGFVKVLFYDPVAEELDPTYRRFVIVPNIHVRDAKLTRRVGTVDIKFPGSGLDRIEKFHAGTHKFKLCPGLGGVGDFDLASADMAWSAEFSYYVCTLNKWLENRATFSDDSDVDGAVDVSRSRTVDRLCDLEGVKFVGNEFMLNSLSARHSTLHPWDGVPANLVTIAKHELRAVEEMQSYWKRRAFSAEACADLMCADTFDCVQARKTLVDAHTKETAAADAVDDADGYMPWNKPAPFCPEVEKTIGSILSAVPGGQDYAKRAEVYGPGPIGNKRKRPDSAPPML